MRPETASRLIYQVCVQTARGNTTKIYEEALANLNFTMPEDESEMAEALYELVDTHKQAMLHINRHKQYLVRWPEVKAGDELVYDTLCSYATTLHDSMAALIQRLEKDMAHFLNIQSIQRELDLLALDESKLCIARYVNGELVRIKRRLSELHLHQRVVVRCLDYKFTVNISME